MRMFIRQLTGVRLVAAVWVMLAHYQPALSQANIEIPVFGDFIRQGWLGVDLFFTLSEFILTYTYLEKLGPRLSGAVIGRFLWFRLARIYPVHFVMLNVAGLAVLMLALVGKTTRTGTDAWFTPGEYVQQLFLVQNWGQYPQPGWNFAAWSLSMEWLAYLTLPFLALVFWRVRDKLAPFAFAVAALVSVSVLLACFWFPPDFVIGWNATIRVLTEFIAGGFVYLFVRRVNIVTKKRGAITRGATVLAWTIPFAIVAISFFATPGGQTDLSSDNGQTPPSLGAIPVIIPLIVAWIGALALTDRGPSRFLASRWLVLGGLISYSLYMVHSFWYAVWQFGLERAGVSRGPIYLLCVIALFTVPFLLAYAMWRLVEEPAREWLRAVVGARPVPIDEAAAP